MDDDSSEERGSHGVVDVPESENIVVEDSPLRGFLSRYEVEDVTSGSATLLHEVDCVVPAAPGSVPPSDCSIGGGSLVDDFGGRAPRGCLAAGDIGI